MGGNTPLEEQADVEVGSRNIFGGYHWSNSPCCVDTTNYQEGCEPLVIDLTGANGVWETIDTA